ncbi:MAG: DMT family transporter [Hyphomicrobiales bacterium]|nr:DMT family transporter [Hyphomicrobiales bacterium]
MKKLVFWFVRQPYLLLTLAAMIWGSNAIAGKLAVGHISPALLVSMRWIFAAMVVLPLAWPHLKRDWPTIKPRLPFLFVLGTMGFTLFNNIMYLALYYTSAINVGIEQASMPLMIFLLNFILFRIKTNYLQITGFTLTLVGVVIAVTNGDPLGIFSQSTNFGDLIMLVAVACYAGYSVALKNKPDIHWLSLVSVLGVSALITSFLFTGLEFYRDELVLPNWYAAGIVIYIAIFPSLIAQISWIRGLEMVGSNRGSLFINFVPVFSSAFAIILLGEQFHLYHALALCLVVGGVALAEYKIINPH